ncbi:MAG: histidine decarboxylase [Planctomycetes bacterium RBG_13_63_9]|nr:MAG: histidine decarboxylase [Planctomycetes bacterium RBG_13_63_9]
MKETREQYRLSAADQRRLDGVFERIKRDAGTFIGYPCNALFDYSPLYRFLSFPVNNVGDPNVPSNFHLNTHDIEREVLDVFRGLTHAAADSFWGYITSGGTEGNMYGIFLGRELYPEGMVYYSEDTHYSVNKILRCLHVRNIMIKSCPDGRIDLEDLRETIRIHRDVPPIIFANVGTTMKGAVDDLEGIRQILKDLAIQQHYIHADAALSGMILPFVDDPQPWDFQAGVDSLSISGHKMIGSPLPCGVAVAKRSNVERIARSIEYVGTLDTTILGSRSAIAPLFLWYAIRTVGMEGFRRRIRHCFEVADYAVDRLKQVGRRAWRHRNSVTVVFDRPSVGIINKWQLAVQYDTAHLITMPHVTGNLIDRLVADVVADSHEPTGEHVSS